MLSHSASSAASPVLGPRRWQRIKAQEFLCCAQTVLPEVTPLFSFLFGFSRINFINYRARYNPGVRVGMERAQCCSCPKQTTMETSALGWPHWAAVPFPAPTKCPRLISNSLTSDINRNGGFWTASNSLELHRSLVIAFYLNARKQPQSY